jgi:Ca2+-transporting ATPase
MLAELLREPMLLLLLAAGGIYLLLGDRGEALMLLGFVAVTVLISLSQEQRTERVLEALRDLTSPRALVRRDGETQRIAGREVVLGDLLLLADGDRVAADATLITAHDLQLDESLLSGESLPVDKRVGAEGDVARVFAGTLVTGGQALAQVTATGPRSVNEWLMRMHEASRQRAYMGTLVVSAGASMSASRIWHVCDGEQQMERVDTLTYLEQEASEENEILRYKVLSLEGQAALEGEST